MIKIFSELTVVKTLLMFFLAVFFSTNVIAQDSTLLNLEFGVNELVYDVSRSIVTVEASDPIYPKNYAKPNSNAIYSVIATGLIYDTTGFVLAPAEAVVDYSSIAIRFDDKTVSATIAAIDYQSGIALLKMQEPHGVPIQLKSQMGCAGQMILAVGNAYGLRASSTLGVCSGYRPDGMMQFSATFTPSSRGGGLFSMNGKLLGIIIKQIGNSSEIGLAIPAYKLPEIVNYLKNNGNRYAGYIGLVTREISILPPIKIQLPGNSRQISMAMGSNTIEISHGLLVEKVTPYSPAYKAGLRKDDLLFQANGLSIDSPLEFASFIQKSSPGTIIEFDFLRHNAMYQVEIPIGKQERATRFSTQTFGSEYDILADSLLKEIELMKQGIKMLERKVKELRQ